MLSTAIFACSITCVLFSVSWGHPNRCPTPPAKEASYRFNVSIPPGCSPPSACTFFAQLRTNNNDSLWLDYYMEGAATGYLALGWNNVSKLSNSDIIACAYNNETGLVQVVDTWVDAKYAVITDPNQSIGTYANGRMSCSYSRSFSTHDSVNDYRISGLFYFLYGWGNEIPSVGVNNTLMFNSPFDLSISSSTINPRYYPFESVNGTLAPATTPPKLQTNSVGVIKAYVLLSVLCLLMVYLVY